MMNSLSIVITSCLKFSDLWENLDVLFCKHWPSHPSIHLVTDKNNIDIMSSFVVHEESGDYSYRLLSVLKQLKSEFVFLSLDDYLPNHNVDQTKIISIISLMKKEKYDYCRIYKNPRFGKTINKKEKIKSLTLKESCYEVNLYPAIWRVNSLIKLIEKDENPWQFEVMLTSRCKDNNFKCISCRDKNVFRFIDTIRKGKYLRKAYKFLKKENLFISSRKKRTIYETVSLNLKTAIGRLIPMPIVRKYRKSKMNKSYSSYAYQKQKEEK